MTTNFTNEDYFKLSAYTYRNYFQKKFRILKTFENFSLNLCESCNLISYRDRDIVKWNRSGILFVTSILITTIMMTIAILHGFPSPMGCASKTCFKVNLHIFSEFFNHIQSYFLLFGIFMKN